MKIGIFGGAFNPPHIGHVNAVKTAVEEHKLDLVFVIPTGTPPHKPLPSGSPPSDLRYQMAENAFGNISNQIKLSEIEVYSQKSNYTIDTIEIIRKDYPEAQLFLLVGDDMYDSLDTWKDSAELLKLVTPILLPRDVINISSTEVRKLLAQRLGLEYITEENYALIIKHRFYNAKPNRDWLRSKAHAMLETKRILHTNGCEQTAMELAQHWGEDVDDACEAAILHDITKKLDFDENLCIIAEGGLSKDDYNISEQKILHSLTASIYAKSEFGISDRVAQAIKLHTTGAAGMSLLDKIIYIADYIEPTRDFPGVDELRQEAFSDIDKAMITGLNMVIDDLTARGIEINKSTKEAVVFLQTTTTDTKG